MEHLWAKPSTHLSPVRGPLRPQVPASFLVASSLWELAVIGGDSTVVRWGWRLGLVGGWGKWGTGRTLRADSDGPHSSASQCFPASLLEATHCGSPGKLAPAEKQGGGRQRLLCQPLGARPWGGKESWEEVSVIKRETRTHAGQWGGHTLTSQDLLLMSNGWKITLNPFLKGREG